MWTSSHSLTTSLVDYDVGVDFDRLQQVNASKHYSDLDTVFSVR